jgi:Mycoplasma protein of unknown function, DUF285
MDAAFALAGRLSLTHTHSSIDSVLSFFLLQKAVSFNGDVASFDTANVVRMDSMFSGATVFNQASVARWNVSKVTNFAETFKDALSFNQNLSSWNVKSVRIGVA